MISLSAHKIYVQPIFVLVFPNLDTDECADAEAVCGLGAHCINLNGSFDCRCRSGFQKTGENCTGLSAN